MDYDYLSKNVEESILLLADGGELAVLAGAAEAGFVYKQYITTGASAGRLAQYPLTCGRMFVTASVVRAHPPLVMVLFMMPSVAEELASLSALHPPMNRAAISSTVSVEPGGKIAGSLERMGRGSKFNLNIVLSPSMRGGEK